MQQPLCPFTTVPIAPQLPYGCIPTAPQQCFPMDASHPQPATGDRVAASPRDHCPGCPGKGDAAQPLCFSQLFSIPLVQAHPYRPLPAAIPGQGKHFPVRRGFLTAAGAGSDTAEDCPTRPIPAPRRLFGLELDPAAPPQLRGGGRHRSPLLKCPPGTGPVYPLAGTVCPARLTALINGH